MGKAKHLEPIHTGGTTHITTRRTPAENKASHPGRQWPRDWNSDGREPGANWPHTRIFSWPLALPTPDGLGVLLPNPDAGTYRSMPLSIVRAGRAGITR